MIRRLDDYGRISLPGEVRRRYHLKEGDPIEIGENPYTIELKKHSPLEVFGVQSKSIFTAFVDTMHLPVILCDTYKVVASKNTMTCENKCISEPLYHCMETADVFNETFSVLKETEVLVSKIEWIKSQGSIIGALIVPKTTNIVTDLQSACLRICAKAIGLSVS